VFISPLSAVREFIPTHPRAHCHLLPAISAFSLIRVFSDRLCRDPDQAGNPEAGVGDYTCHFALNLRRHALASLGACRSIAVIASSIRPSKASSHAAWAFADLDGENARN
jgi:hypothetical protein